MTIRPTKSTHRSATRLVLALTLCLYMALSVSCGPSTAVPDGELDAGAAGTPSPTMQGSVCDVGVHGDLENVTPTGQIVTYWHPYAGANEELLHSLVDEFNRTNGSGIYGLCSHIWAHRSSFSTKSAVTSPTSLALCSTMRRTGSSRNTARMGSVQRTSPAIRWPPLMVCLSLAIGPSPSKT